MNLRQTDLTSVGNVAVNIITCLSKGVFWNTSWMSLRLSGGDAANMPTNGADLQVAFIHHEVFQVLHGDGVVPNEVCDAAGRADENVATSLQHLHVLLQGNAAKHRLDHYVVEEATQTMEFLRHLNGHLARVAEDETADLQGNTQKDRDGIYVLDILKHGNDKHTRLSHSRTRLTEDVSLHEGFGNTLTLHCG